MVKVDVDKIWLALGVFGRHQKQQVLLFTINMTAIAYAILVYVFAGYRPPFTCKPPSNKSWSLENHFGVNQSDIKLTEDTCDISVVSNNTNGSSPTVLMVLPCENGYNYDVNQDTIVTEWNLVCDKSGKGEFTQSLNTMGQISGALLLLPLADRYGRKKIFVSVGTVMLFSTTLISLSPNYHVYAAMRFLSGLCVEGAGMVMYIYIFEMFPGKYRSRLGAFGSFCWSTNVVTITAFGYGLRNYSWRYLHLATGIISAIYILTYWFCDESLRWLIVNGKIKEAKILIQKIAKKNHKDPETILPLLNTFTINLEVVKNGIDDVYDEAVTSDDLCLNNPDESTTHGRTNSSVLDILRNKILLKIALIWMFIWFTNSVTYYGLLLSSVQLKGNRFLNYFINGLVEMPSNVVYLLLVNRVSRRKLTIGFHLLAGIPMILSIVLIRFKDTHEFFQTAAIACSFIAKTGITGSYNTIFVYLPETYPTNLRNLGLGLASSASHIGGIIAPFSSLLAYYIEWGPGVIFGSCCLLVSFLCWFLPETRKRPLPQTIEDIEKWNRETTDFT